MREPRTEVSKATAIALGSAPPMHASLPALSFGLVDLASPFPVLLMEPMQLEAARIPKPWPRVLSV